jgi:hypothetical protein
MTFRPNNSHERNAKGATIDHKGLSEAEQVAGLRFVGQKMDRGNLPAAGMLGRIRDSAERLYA